MKEEENELTYGEVKAVQDKADLANVIDSLQKLELFEELTEEGARAMRQSIAILEKMYDRETK